VPGAARIALLVEPANVRITEGIIVRDVESAARVMGLQIRVLNANSSREIDTAFATLARERPDASRQQQLLFQRRRVQWPTGRRTTGSPRHMRDVNMSKPAG